MYFPMLGAMDLMPPARPSIALSENTTSQELSEEAPKQRKFLTQEEKLFYATQEGKENKVKKILAKHPATKINITTPCGKTPLIIACWLNHYEIAKTLLKAGANPNIRVGECGTPLVAAAHNGHEWIVALLLQNGADPDLTDRQGLSPLLWATINGHKYAATVLLNAKANPNTRCGCSNLTPLIEASYFGRTNIVIELLKAGASPHVRGGFFNESPLKKAVFRGHLEIARLLLEAGANLEEIDGQEKTLKDVVIERREKEFHKERRNIFDDIITLLDAHSALRKNKSISE
jgi:ankyrin repeat protein